MKALRRLVKYGFLALLVVALIVTVWFNARAKAALPMLDGEVRHETLSGEVRVVRDDWGVPHILAADELDGYFALGYVMAQDRLFQMELMRRLAGGQLSELVGKPAVRVDRIVRGFRLRPKAADYLAMHQDSHPEIRAISERFCAGINHFMDTEELPLEFAVLGIQKRPFTPVDCLSIGAILPITFADGLREDALNTILKAIHPDLDTDELFPGYHKEVPVTVMETLEEAAQWAAEHPEHYQVAGNNDKALASVAAMRSLVADLHDIRTMITPALGSNSWVAGPSRTKSGRAMLANDPHIGFTNPSIWYEANIKAGDFEWYGWYLPLIPFSLIGHNRHHSWALTMLANDDVDLYREEFKPDDPTKVKYKGEWTDVLIEEEEVPVRFGATETAQIRVTKHGPVITDLLSALMEYNGPDVSMSWVWQHLEYTDMIAFHRMARAKSIEEFEAAVALITSPGLNVSYADAEDNIAWWAAGRIPIRPPHVNNKALLDGASGKDEILGYVDFADNPKLINPEWGYIATANNKSTFKSVGDVPDMQGYWQPGDRAARIEEVLDTRDDWDIEGFQALQFDDKAWAADFILPRILNSLRIVDLTRDEKEAVAILEHWDHLHGKDSVGAMLYQMINDRIMYHLLADELGEGLLGPYHSLADSWNFYKFAMKTPSSAYWNKIDTPDIETQGAIIVQGFRAAIAFLREELGDDIHAWEWGKLHTMTFKHPFGYIPGLGGIFNVGPFPASGGDRIVNNMLYLGNGNFEVVAGPSTRRVIDFADPETAYAILPTGNSGHIKSPHYGDQAPLFMDGKYRVVNFTRDQIEAHKKHELIFAPPN